MDKTFTDAVWQSFLPYREKIVLLAMIDEMDSEFVSSLPKPGLVKKCGLGNRSTVRDAQRRLEDLGVVTELGRNTSVYKIHLPRLKQLCPDASSSELPSSSQLPTPVGENYPAASTVLSTVQYTNPPTIVVDPESGSKGNGVGEAHNSQRSVSQNSEPTKSPATLTPGPASDKIPLGFGDSAANLCQWFETCRARYKPKAQPMPDHWQNTWHRDFRQLLYSGYSEEELAKMIAFAFQGRWLKFIYRPGNFIEKNNHAKLAKDLKIPVRELRPLPEKVVRKEDDEDFDLVHYCSANCGTAVIIEGQVCTDCRKRMGLPEEFPCATEGCYKGLAKVDGGYCHACTGKRVSRGLPVPEEPTFGSVEQL